MHHHEPGNISNHAPSRAREHHEPGNIHEPSRTREHHKPGNTHAPSRAREHLRAISSQGTSTRQGPAFSRGMDKYIAGFSLPRSLPGASRASTNINNICENSWMNLKSYKFQQKVYDNAVNLRPNQSVSYRDHIFFEIQDEAFLFLIELFSLIT